MAETEQKFTGLEQEIDNGNAEVFSWNTIVPYNATHIYNGGMSYRLCGGYRYMPIFYGY